MAQNRSRHTLQAGPKEWNDELTQRIIAAVIRVHSVLGPGFLENVYRRALMVELQRIGLVAEGEKRIKIIYEGVLVGTHRLDIVVAQTVVVELKTVKRLNRHHYAQLRSYLKAAGLRVGLLVNFALAKAEFRRVEHEIGS
ncbi:MAG TPA: GxxExxY protein [Planctomycetaceae bacterium]|nr:GxxExxY protein [Planctomycetaceae bacterium]